MAIVEAEIVSAVKEGITVVVGVVYRVNSVENSREQMRFSDLQAADISRVQEAILVAGRRIKGSVEAEVVIKGLVGTKIQIEDAPPDPVPVV